MKHRKPHKWSVLNLPEARGIIKGNGKENLFVMYDRVSNVICLVHKKSRYQWRAEKRILCHYDLELKQTVNNVEVHEFV